MLREGSGGRLRSRDGNRCGRRRCRGLWNDNNPNGDIKGGLKALFNIGLQGVGVLASIYTLGTAGKVGLEVKKFA